METNVTALQKEIERLNIIILALAEQNVQLKNENLRLKQTSDKEITTDHSSAKIPDGTNETVYSSAKNGEGINNLNNSSAKNQDISKQIIHSSGEIGKGINYLNDSSAEKDKGITDSNYSFPENGEGIKQINVALVQKGLRHILSSRSHATIDKAAKILMLLYQNPKQPYKTLMHLTRLSAAGMPKHIMMLKRKGLVMRTAFQTYTLTQLSISIIKEAMQ